MENKNYKVYMYTNLINNKKYIGQTCQKLSARSGKDGWHYHRQTKFYNDIKLYGWNNFKREVIKDNLTKEEAKILEEKMIIKYNSITFGYNISQGVGCKGYHQTEDAKQKISKAQTGRKHTEEQKIKIKNFFDTYYLTHEHYMTGKHWTEEYKEKFVLSRSGKNNPNYGKFGYDNPTSKIIVQFTKDYKFIAEYGSAREAMRVNNYKTVSHICDCANHYGKIKSYKGYIWEWKENLDENYNLINDK